MCLMCEEEDLYFLYLERLERENKAARGESSPPDAHWLWPALASAQPADAAQVTAAKTRPAAKPTFACDAPGGE